MTGARGEKGNDRWSEWRDYLGALKHKVDAADEALIDSLVPRGHTSTPGYKDPKFPILGRVPRSQGPSDQGPETRE